MLNKISPPHRLTQHIRYAPVGRMPFGTLLPSVATSYMLEPLYEIPNPAFKKERLLYRFRSNLGV